MQNKLKPKDIIFEDYSLTIDDPVNEGEKLILHISDGLYACDEEHTEEYKNKICDFLNSSSKWYDTCTKAIKHKAKSEYNMECSDAEIVLVEIYILFEQNEEPLFGIGFGVDFDNEHGVGIQVSGNDYKIAKVGEADTAFC